MRTFWMNGKPNFGDQLTPYVFDYFGISHSMSAKLGKCRAMCIGSIAHRATDDMIVLGSGLMFADKFTVNPNADYRFVRGPYTRQKIIDAGSSCPKVYGDPAMLLPLFCEESEKEYDVGIVPHYVDYEYTKQQYPNYKVIDVINTDPLVVAKEITKCKKIISTSLHGIIGAHAYGIPAAWVKFSKKVKGDGIKFNDHYASLGLTAQSSTVEDPIYTTGTLDLNPMISIFENLSQSSQITLLQ